MKKLLTLIAMVTLAMSAMAQTQHVYQWKNGSVTITTTAVFDSLTFSLPDDAVSFTTGNPSALTESTMTATYSVSSDLSISNSSSTTEQGVCYSMTNESPTIDDNTQVYGTMYKGSWKSTLSTLRTGASYYYRPYLKIADAVFYGPIKSFTVLGDYVEPSGYAVDLGLPSGTLWADRNIGADSPEAYGDYFAWGEITTKITYSWNNYKWCNGTYDSQTKYCTKDSYGTVDDLTTLESEDDAATANWGKQWRMPTYEEMKELRTECTWTWTTQNSVNGYKVTGPNGNSIFLPAAGYLRDSSLYYAGSSGFYWSGSLSESYPCNAWYLFISSSSCSPHDYGDRYDGFTVRAVAQ